MALNLVALLVFFLGLLSFTAISSAFDEGRSKSRIHEFRIGDLLFTTVKNSQDEYVFTFSMDDKVIFESNCAFKIQDPKIISGLPRSDCRSFSAYCFSGGAHCCTSLLLATHCESRTVLDEVDLLHSPGEVRIVSLKGHREKQVVIFDWQFAYYAPDDSDLQLSFAESPEMVRLLVFEKDRWRIDRIGEFSKFYTRLAKQITVSALTSRKRLDPERTAARAIKAVYYYTMAGVSEQQASTTLTRLLPNEWKHVSGRISEDIRRAALEFNPVEGIR